MKSLLRLSSRYAYLLSLLIIAGNSRSACASASPYGLFIPVDIGNGWFELRQLIPVMPVFVVSAVPTLPAVNTLTPAFVPPPIEEPVIEQGHVESLVDRLVVAKLHLPFELTSPSKTLSYQFANFTGSRLLFLERWIYEETHPMMQLVELKGCPAELLTNWDQGIRAIASQLLGIAKFANEMNYLNFVVKRVTPQAGERVNLLLWMETPNKGEVFQTSPWTLFINNKAFSLVPVVPAFGTDIDPRVFLSTHNDAEQWYVTYK